MVYILFLQVLENVIILHTDKLIDGELYCEHDLAKVEHFKVPLISNEIVKHLHFGIII